MGAAGNADNLVDMTSCVDTDLTVATMTGAIETDYAAQLGLNSIEVGGPQDGLDAINSGNADAFALTGISLNWMAENSNVDVEVTDTFVQEIDGVLQYGAGGTVFRDEDTSLLDAYNEVLAEIVARSEEHTSELQS